MEIKQIDTIVRERVNTFITAHWFTTEMAVHGEIIDLSAADGFYTENDGEITGLITFRTADSEAEILSLDSIYERQGVGTALVDKVIEYAKSNNIRRIKVITTNDDLNAVKFYQKRGFDMAALYLNAVEKARLLKPEIPLIGMNGIPIRHEIELEMIITRDNK